MNAMDKVVDEVKEGYYRTLAQSAVKALKKKGFEAIEFNDADEAAKWLIEHITAGASVAAPGSVTVRQLNVLPELEAKGCRVIQHWGEGKSEEDRQKARLEEFYADYFLTSSNAMTLDGELVNIDGMGNRLAGMCFGPGELIYIIGANKITANVDQAINRIGDIASPMNNIRLGKNTPCTKTGYCVDCESPERSCRLLLVTQYPPMGRKVYVLLIARELGY